MSEKNLSQSKNNLMMELEHGGVRDYAGVQKPPDQLVQEGELVLDAWGSHQLTLIDFLESFIWSMGMMNFEF